MHPKASCKFHPLFLAVTQNVATDKFIYQFYQTAGCDSTTECFCDSVRYIIISQLCLDIGRQTIIR